MARSHEEISKAVDVSIEVFRKEGYERTAIEDLVDATGLNRYAIYQKFGGKRDLFLAALHRDHELTMRELQSRIETSSKTAIETMKEFIQGPLQELVTAQATGFAGPLVCQAAFELGPHDDYIADHVKKYMDQKQAYLTQIFEHAQQDGSLRPGIKPSDAACMLLVVIYGVTAISKCSRGREEIQASLDSTFAILSA